VNIRASLIAKRHESDGRVTDAQLAKDCYNFPNLPKLKEEQYTVGTWERDGDDAFVVVDFLVTNKSHAELREIREARALSGRIGGLRSGESRRSNQDASNQDASTTPSILLDTSNQDASTDESALLRHVEPKAKQRNATEMNATERKSNEESDVPNVQEIDRSSPISYSEQFEALWTVYVLKVDKAAASKCVSVLLKDGVPLEDLINAASNYAVSIQGTDPKFIKHAKNFFGPERCWAEWVSVKAPPTRTPEATSLSDDECAAQLHAEIQDADSRMVAK
jgi:hypothetical protein